MLHTVSEAARERLMWSDGFATGIVAVDAQHRRLLTLLDQVRGLVADRHRPDHRAQLEQVVEALNDYAAQHFLTEETLLRQHLATHPGTSAHIRAHRSYWTQVAGFKRQLRYGESGVEDALYAFLRQWWIGHILTVDQEMGTALRPLLAGK